MKNKRGGKDEKPLSGRDTAIRKALGELGDQWPSSNRDEEAHEKRCAEGGFGTFSDDLGSYDESFNEWSWDRNLDLIEIADRKISSGWPTLDFNMSGGLGIGKRMLINGGPGRGKTAIAAHYAMRAALAGISVIVIAADQGKKDFTGRLAQQCGLDRETVERFDEKAMQLMQLHLGDLPIHIYECEEMSLVELALRLASSEPTFVVIDSIQSVIGDRENEPADANTRVDAHVGLVRDILGKSPATSFLLTSEVARGNYGADKGKSLGAAKGSSALEYFADLVMTLFEVTDLKNVTRQLSRLKATKNRLPPNVQKFELCLQFEGSHVIEIAAPPHQRKKKKETIVEEVEDIPSRARARVGEIRQAVAEALEKEAPRTISVSEIRRQVKQARGLEPNFGSVMTALKTLIEEQRIVAVLPKDGGSAGYRWT